jgi:hypothetical protein
MNKVSPGLRAPRLPIVRSGRCRGSEQLPRNVASRFGVRQRFHQSNHRHREINQSIFQFLRSHRSKSKIQNQQSSIVNPSSIFNVRSPSLQGALPRREWPVARQKIGDWRFPHSKVPKSKIQNQQSSIVNPSSISNVRSPSLQGALPRREWPVARFQGSVRRVKSECSSFFASATACQSHLPVFSPDLPCLFQQEEESLTIVD